MEEKRIHTGVTNPMEDDQKPVLTTTHKLQFEVAPPPFGDFMLFRVGSCHGQWRSTPTTYDILSIINNDKHNGHLDDVFEWFEFCAKRDNLNLRVLQTWNKRFRNHLINKRGFKVIDSLNLIKTF